MGKRGINPSLNKITKKHNTMFGMQTFLSKLKLLYKFDAFENNSLSTVFYRTAGSREKVLR